MRISRTVEGPAPTDHQVRSVTLQVTEHPGGGLVVRAREAPGWSTVVRTQDQLARAVAVAFREVQCAAYSMIRGQAYDMDDTGVTRPRPRRSGPGRKDVHDIADWQRMEDGRWRSPTGRTYRADSALALRIQRKRVSQGLPG